ncbi:hypothetical protein H7H37_15100, partial [Mycolicibacterium insubricum]|nr:hypothetical protein [Mycolicibacterium insubricum]
TYGVPFNNDVPAVGGITISTMFFAAFAVTAIYAFYLHFAPPGPVTGDCPGR